MQALLMVQYVLNEPDLFDYTTVKDMEEFILFTFSAEEVLKEQLARRL